MPGFGSGAIWKQTRSRRSRRVTANVGAELAGGEQELKTTVAQTLFPSATCFKDT